MMILSINFTQLFFNRLLLLYLSSRNDNGVRSYQDKDDNDLIVPQFKPGNIPGIQLPELRTKQDTMKYTTAVILFSF